MSSENNSSQDRNFIQSFIINNPFYLLSALLMIIGCYLVLSPFQQISRSITDILIYLGIVNFYEAILIITAIYLMVHKKIIRDGVILLLIECFFLADVTLMSPVYQFYGVWDGIALSLTVTILAILKIYFIVRYLNLHFNWAFYCFAIIGLFFLYLSGNAIFIGIKEGINNPMLLYIIWSIAGLIPAILIGISGRLQKTDGFLSIFNQKAQVVFVWIVIGLTLIHLGTITWIVDATFYLCFISTLFISLAVIVPKLAPRWGEAEKLSWMYILPLSAILITAYVPLELVLDKSRFFPVTLSPLRINLILAAWAFAYFYIVYRQKLCLVFGSACLLSSVLGNDFESIFQVFEKGPQTKKGWGIVSIIGAFVLFICGFLVSLRKSRIISLTKEPDTKSGEQSPELTDAKVKGEVKTSKSAIWSLICGIFGLILCLPSIPSIILGIIALVNISKSKGLLKGTGMAIAGFILSGLSMITASIYIPMVIDTGRDGGSNEYSAVAGLKMLVSQEAIWRQQDCDGNGIKDYWTYDVSFFNRMYRADGVTKINFIDISFARADYARAVDGVFGVFPVFENWDSGETAFLASAKSGYCYQTMKLDGNGDPYNQNEVGENKIKATNSSKFAFVAYPELCGSSGTGVFIINEKGIVYGIYPDTDSESKIVLQWPGPKPELVKGPGGRCWTLAE
ncbi:MAG: DUF4190 domain-containing protein [Planctomycetota bacterium]